ncbi:PorT family protein [Flavobacterium sp. F-328]|jgi:hypothetical protein|uniref:PorT family protein n=1 Tax=Flavobacterium erciyesense TaxID=2825842 RepID=A0ABS5D118_9FLAO|nr:porin family protein [Flavobacterium erciyesense]MBQ0907704.1 PorT family protein [Flavobacterium erciyesense]
MKKLILAAIVLCGTTMSMNAQSIKFGLKAGINYANQSGSGITVNSDNFDKEAITSYHAGLIAEINITEGFAIQPELLYSTQGATYKNATEEFKNELGYLSIPVLAKFKLSNALSLDLGPQASFLLSERENVDFKKSETFEFGAAAGLTVNLTKSIFLQGRYVAGLTEASRNAEIKNSVVQVSAGFKF